MSLSATFSAVISATSYADTFEAATVVTRFDCTFLLRSTSFDSSVLFSLLTSITVELVCQQLKEPVVATVEASLYSPISPTAHQAQTRETLPMEKAVATFTRGSA